MESNRPKLVKITKEQFDRIFKSNSINESSQLNQSVESKGIEKETLDLIEYLYRKTDEFSPFWGENDLSYDDICDALESKNLIIKKDGGYMLSKSLGSPEEAISAVEAELNNMIGGTDKIQKKEIEEGDWFDNLSNHPANQPDPVYTKASIDSGKLSFDPLYFNGEICLLKDKSGQLYILNYYDIDEKDLDSVAYDLGYVEKEYIGRDEDGDPEFEYHYNWRENDDEELTVMAAYADEISDKAGEGLQDYNNSVELVKIDDELKADLMDNYDKDTKFISLLSNINEGETEDERMARLKAVIAQRRADSQKYEDEYFKRRDAQNRMNSDRAEKEMSIQNNPEPKKTEPKKPIGQHNIFGGVDEMTSSVSSGAFTGSLSGDEADVVKKTMPNVPVVREDSELGAGYTHFAIFKSDGKIASGWDYKGVNDDKDIKYYSKMDLIDNFPENKHTEFLVVPRKNLENKGIDPSDTNNWYKITMSETTTVASAGNFQYDTPGGLTMDLGKNNPKSKAEKNTQWAGGSFVEFNDCVDMNNKPAGTGCSTGAVDGVVKLKKTRGNINAPSLNEGMVREALKLQHDKKENRLIVVSDLEGRAASQETFKNKTVLKQSGFVWTGTNWAIPSDKLEVAKKTLSLVNKAEYIIDTLEDLESVIEDSAVDNKDLLKSRLEQYISDLANATDEKVLSAEIRRYLTFFSKFHSYSFYNRILIFIQKPDATKVASYNTWKSKHRQVNKGAKAINILAPASNPKAQQTPEDDSEMDMLTAIGANRPTVTRFRAVNVFDISDTTPIDERGEVPETPQWWGENTPSETADTLFGAVSEVAKDMGINVTQSDGKGGEKGYSAGDHINISSDVSGAARLSTMIHEIAHELMHWKKSSIYFIDNGEGRQKSELQELQAESVSYVVLKHYGIPVAHHTTYLALWKANKERIQNNLEIISKVSQFLITKIDDQVSELNKTQEN